MITAPPVRTPAWRVCCAARQRLRSAPDPRTDQPRFCCHRAGAATTKCAPGAVLDGPLSRLYRETRSSPTDNEVLKRALRGRRAFPVPGHGGGTGRVFQIVLATIGSDSELVRERPREPAAARKIRPADRRTGRGLSVEPAEIRACRSLGRGRSRGLTGGSTSDCRRATPRIRAEAARGRAHMGVPRQTLARGLWNEACALQARVLG